MREKFLALRTRVDDLATQAGRDDPVDILLAVKTHTSQTIRQAIEAGGTLIGHNRAQELVATEPDLVDLDHETHFIGMLQTNKVNQVLRHATCVQSVHTTRLADRLNRAAGNRDLVLDVFVQVNTSQEESKSGVDPAGALDLAAHVGSLENLRLRGLMTVGANSTDPGVVRASYESLAILRDKVVASGETGTQNA
ncbi:MAG TPA: alanine racemase, partial [Beutenbergiaceae bacterium]|nr:alanine racemase [Beutenbergiaceae bacterium]